MVSVVCKRAATLSAAIGALLPGLSMADTPLGWINSTITSAYTLDSLDVEVTAAALAVNETIDVFNFREDLLAGNSRLSNDSGDLSGYRGEIQLGLGSMFTLVYRQQNQDLTVRLANQARLDLEDVDTELSTSSRAYGVRWNFFEMGRQDDDAPWHAASIEITRTENKTDDFQAFISRVQISANSAVNFDPPQAFQLDRLEDKGWQGRLIYTFPVFDSVALSTWIGYGSMEGSSGTSSDIDTSFIRSAFEQSFQTEETQYLAGASLNWQLMPRLPLQFSYEYINIKDRELVVERNPTSVFLPSFLRASNLGNVEDNHIVTGSISYWLTPRLNIGLQGKYFSNQFLGIMPHYNNPLSGAFADTAYGYAAIQLGYRL